MNKCISCDWYRPKTSFCGYYLKGVEKAIEFCDFCRMRRGEWLSYCPNTSTCSECGFIVPDWFVSNFKYCPNCGSRMVE